MPNNIVKSFADKTNKSSEEVEKKWDKAKDIVKKEYPDVEEDSEDFYKIVVGVLKKMLGISEEITLGTIGGTKDGESDPSAYKYYIKIGKKKKKLKEWKDYIKSFGIK